MKDFNNMLIKYGAKKIGWGWKFEDVNYFDYKAIDPEPKQYVQITNGARNGAIGYIVAISACHKIKIKFEDKPTSEISIYEYLCDERNFVGNGHSKYIFTKNAKEPAVLYNKYGQQIEKDAFVFGTSKGRLMFGRVSRFTEKTVWITPYLISKNDSYTNKNSEAVMDSYSETFILPEHFHEDIEAYLMMARLTVG